MATSINRLRRLTKALDWGDDIDPEREFWRSALAWDALGGLLIVYGTKGFVAAACLYQDGNYEGLKTLFLRACARMKWDKPTERQLSWGIEAVRRQLPTWQASEWWFEQQDKLKDWLEAGHKF